MTDRGNRNAKDPRQRITRVVEGWFLTEPLLFAAWTMHDVLPQPNIATIRVGRGRIEFNANFIASLNNANLRHVLAFETFRILLGHPSSRRQANAELSYAASNLSVQECLRTRLPIPRARDVLGGEEYDNQYFEYYYRQLVERAEEERSHASEEQDQTPSQNSSDPTEPDDPSEPDGESESNDPSDSNRGTDSTETSDQSGPPQSTLADYADQRAVGQQNTQSWDSDDLLKEEISVAIQEAAQGDGWGTLGGHAQERLKATLKPPLDYRGVIRQFRQSTLSVDRKLTRMKPSRRYGFDQMGSRYDFTTHLLFAVDVSGSMSREELQTGFSIVNRFFQYGIRSIDVLSFDTQITQPPTTLRHARSDIEISGRGGTDFQCLMNFLDGESKYKPSVAYDGMIVFTDGQAPEPKPTKNRRTRILWLFQSESAYQLTGPKLSRFGLTAFVRPSHLRPHD